MRLTTFPLQTGEQSTPGTKIITECGPSLNPFPAHRSITARYTCQPSLLNAVRSYERKNDWGLIYPARILVKTSR